MKRIKARIKKFMQTSVIFYALYKKIVYTKRYLTFKRYQKSCPLEEKTIMFESFQGRKYACSPKAMFLEAVKDPRFSDYTFIWAVRNLKEYAFLKDFPNTKLVKYNTKGYLRVCATAKYWVTNSTMLVYTKPSKKQVVIQCWHGTPLKRLGCDIDILENKAQKLPEIHKQYKNQGKVATFFPSPSKFYTEKIGSAFDVKGEQLKSKFVECGYPRNDFLFSYTDADVERIKTELSIPKDKKVLLYAPTFRDNTFERGKGFHYDIGIDFDLLKNQLGDEYVILFRAHYFVIDNFDLSGYEGFVIDVSRHNDINELYIVSDMLLTDYSSVFFDYANLNRPVMFFMYDYEFYKGQMRDFYLTLDDLPGPVVYKNDELVSMIRETEKNFTYDEKYREFNERFNSFNDQNSSKRVWRECVK